MLEVKFKGRPFHLIQTDYVCLPVVIDWGQMFANSDAVTLASCG